MKEITIPVLWASAEYYLGALLWVGLVAVLIAIGLWLLALRRSADVRASVFGVKAPVLVLATLTALAVTASIPTLTGSAWGYVAGPTDYVVLIGAGAAAAFAVGFLLTPILMLMRPRRA